MDETKAGQEAGAVLSDCGRYRYRLWRKWGRGFPSVAFVMLNPSTADAEQDDPTIRRCIGYAKAWGYGCLEVVNLFALRATDPVELRKCPAPVGPANLTHVEEAATMSDIVVCAWGAHVFAAGQAVRTLARLRRGLTPLMCLRRTKNGSPAHPLYLPGGLRPIPFSSGEPPARPPTTDGSASMAGKEK